MNFRKTLHITFYTALILMVCITSVVAGGFGHHFWEGSSVYNNITFITNLDYDTGGYETVIWSAKDTSGKYGIIDSKQNILFPFELDECPTAFWDFDNHCCILAQKNGKYGILNEKMENMIPFELEGEPEYLHSEYIYSIKSNGKCAYYNVLTNKKTDYLYDSITRYPEYDAEYEKYVKKEGKYFLTSSNGKLGALNMDGSTILHPEFDEITQLIRNKDLLKIKADGKYGIADYSGTICIETIYEDIDYVYSEKQLYYTAKQNGKYGVLTQSGKNVTDFCYDSIDSHIDGLNKHQSYLDVIAEEKNGIIDIRGNIVIPIEYDHLESIFETLLLSGNKDSKTYVIDYNNNVVTEFDRQFDYVVYGTENYYYLVIDEMVGIGDRNGNVLIDVIHEDGSIAIEGENTVLIYENGNNSTNIIQTITLPPVITASPSIPSITMPSFSVTVNGTLISNTTALYPCIVYNDITYFPMTYSDSRALGLVADWTAENGLVIEKTDTEPYAPSFEQGENANASGQTAAIVEGKVTVNGKAIDNLSEEYPLLLFRDVTYFPLTWRFAVEEFGWDYSFTSEKGLIINSK